MMSMIMKNIFQRFSRLELDANMLYRHQISPITICEILQSNHLDMINVAYSPLSICKKNQHSEYSSIFGERKISKKSICIIDVYIIKSGFSSYGASILSTVNIYINNHIIPLFKKTVFGGLKGVKDATIETIKYPSFF